MSGTQLTLHDRSGELSVYLHEPSGDHIVIRYRVDKRGGEYAAALLFGSKAWDHAVQKAFIGSVFL